MFATLTPTPRAIRIAARFRARAADLEVRAAEGRADSESRYAVEARVAELRRRADVYDPR